MKSEHRHELKTNELAEWLSNLPEWTRKNLNTIVVISVLVITVAALYFWRSYSKNVVEVREQLEFTNLLVQFTESKMQVVHGWEQGRDLSFILLKPAEDLGDFARNTKNDRMAALALIKRGEALRTELHYRPGEVSKSDLTEQINKAKVAYTEAIRRASADQTLIATAEFGLGLCEEELGNFEGAKQIYKDIVENPNYEGLVAVAAAKDRLATMDDYRQEVVFKPAPAEPVVSQPESIPPTVASRPVVEIVDSNLVSTSPNIALDATVPDKEEEPLVGPPVPNDVSESP